MEAARGGQRLALAFYDPARQRWQVMDTEVNAEEQTLTVETAQPGRWGVVATSSPGRPAGGVDGMHPQPPNGNETAARGQQGRLTSPDGRVTIEFDPASVAEPLRIDLRSMPLSDRSLVMGQSELTFVFRMDLLDSEGRLADKRFPKPVRVNVSYTQQELESAGGNPSLLSLTRFDPDQEAWVLVPSEVDVATRTVSTDGMDVGLWGIMTSRPPGNPGLPLAAWAAMGAVAAAGSAAGIYFLRRRMSF